MRATGRWGLWAGLVVGGAAIVAAGFAVRAIGLDNADKVASVVGLGIAAVGLVLAVLSFRRDGSAPAGSAGIEAGGDISGIAAIGHAGGARQGGEGDHAAPDGQGGPPPQGTIKAGGSISGIAAIGDGRADAQDRNR
ncbi:hypothetical protein GCM10022221_23970 [Actinocorallia aurea]